MSRTGRTLTGGIATLATALAAFVASPAAVATSPADDGLIVFEATVDDGVQLFTIRPDGTDMRQITHTELRPGADNPGASHPHWSPDGRTILFDENDCQIALIDPDGSDLREVPAEPGHRVGIDFCENEPSFTPDGQSIVYERFDGKSDQTWIMGLDGTDKRLFSTSCPAGANISPDGSKLSCGGGDGGGIWVMNMDGSGAVEVTPSGWAVAPRHYWAPDGSAILFTARPTPDDQANIATVAPDGSDVRWLTDDQEIGARAGSYSPDGGSIVLRLTKGDDQHALARMAADGSGLEQLTEFSTTWPGLDGVGFNEGHFPVFAWGPAPAD